MSWGWIFVAIAGVLVLCWAYGTYLEKHPEKHPDRLAEQKVESRLRAQFESEAEQYVASKFEDIFTAGMQAAQTVPPEPVYETPDEVTEPMPADLIASINDADDLQAWKDAGNRLPASVLVDDPELAARWLELK